MRAVRFTDFGIGNLEVAEVPGPAPAAGEVLIATEAATINAADAAIVTGAAVDRFPRGATPPYTPGWDLAGRVVAAGDDVGAPLVGAQVVGMSVWYVTGQGTQASEVALPVASVAVAPGDVPATCLTTVGLNGLTAWRAVDEAELTAGETVVVTGAAGSVGGFAVELAVARGARVIGYVYPDDAGAVLALGASAVVTTEDGDLASAVRAVVPGGADALIDTASLAAAALGAVRDSGRYVTVTVTPEPERGVRVSRVYARPDREALATLVKMAADGRLDTPIAAEYDVARVRAAYADFADGGHRRGRVVLTF
jgi:NADPH:quinone reductase